MSKKTEISGVSGRNEAIRKWGPIKMTNDHSNIYALPPQWYEEQGHESVYIIVDPVGV